MSNIQMGFKKALKIAVFVLLGMAVLGYFVSKDKKKSPIEGNKITEHEQKIDSKTISNNYIEGIQPPDIYLNFEKIGYKTDKKIGNDGSFFYSTFSKNGIDYNVTTYCESNINKVNSVVLQATGTYPQYNKVTDMKPFLQYGCSIPYEGSTVEKVSEFIDANYYKNNSSLLISGVKFTIFAPTPFARSITIEKNNPR